MDSEVEAATYERSKGSNQEKGKANSRMTVIMRRRKKPHDTGIEKQGASRRMSQGWGSDGNGGEKLVMW